MFTIIGGDGKPYGPVSEEKLRRWLAEGRVSYTVSAQRKGEPVWRTLGEFMEFGGIHSAYGPKGGEVERAESVQAGKATRVEAGRGKRERQGGRLTLQVVVTGTRLYGATLGPATGMAWMTVIAVLMVGQAGWLGPFLMLALGGVLLGGTYRYLLARLRGDEAGFEVYFSGFTQGPVKLALAGVASSALVWGTAAAAGMAMLLPLVILGWVGILLGWLVSLVVMGAAFYLWLTLVFAVPLVADRGMGVAQGLARSYRMAAPQAGRVLLLLAGLGMALMVGLLAFFVGVLLVLPWTLCVLASAYEQVRTGGRGAGQ